MTCPHCLKDIHEQFQVSRLLWAHELGLDADRILWQAARAVCPSCLRSIIKLIQCNVSLEPVNEFVVWPKATARPVPPEVPETFAADYREAALVLTDSPKASAALSRRCLQAVLREAAHVKPGSLAREIEEVLQSKALPSDLARAVDAIRNVGNFSAHAVKCINTGEIVDVEPGEAEWLLDVLESLFDFYFVRPALLAAKRDALNKKLEEAGKPPMK